MLFAGQTGRLPDKQAGQFACTHGRGRKLTPPQAQRTEKRRPQGCRLALQPANDIRGRDSDFALFIFHVSQSRCRQKAAKNPISAHFFAFRDGN
jgi:hypothetical protein